MNFVVCNGECESCASLQRELCVQYGYDKKAKAPTPEKLAKSILEKSQELPLKRKIVEAILNTPVVKPAPVGDIGVGGGIVKN